MPAPTDPEARAYACLALVDAMTRLHGISPEGLTPVLRGCWDSLEKTTLETLPGADYSLLNSDVLFTRSAALLAMLPDSERAICTISPGATLAMLNWISADHLALAIRKGFYPTEGVAYLLDHAPGEPAWDRIACEELSPRQFVHLADGPAAVFVLSSQIGQIENLPRLALFLEAQTRHHPQDMALQLVCALEGQASLPGVALALILAGARIEDASREVTPTREFAGLARLAASNHGRLEIARKYGPLTSALERLHEVPNISDIQT